MQALCGLQGVFDLFNCKTPVFPAIDIQKSGTRREDLLLSREEQETVYNMRKALNSLKADEAVEQILNMFSRTRTNAEFVQMAKKQKFL